MTARSILERTGMRRDVADIGEHPDVIVADIVNRPRPPSRIIVVANEKGGVGKSTIAFHICVALADTGLKVAAIDLDRRQQTLSRTLQNRDATARRLQIALPMPRHNVLQNQSAATLCHEINRIGWDSDVVVIDAAGHDSGIARRAIALADTLVTPVNNSFVDLDLLGRFHPVTLDILSPGCFAQSVNEIRKARTDRGLADLDWVVVQNRTRRGASQNQGRFEVSLKGLAQHVGFRLGRGMAERVAYRELFLLGLTHLDVRRLPGFPKSKLVARQEILMLLSDIAAPKSASVAGEKSPCVSDGGKCES